MKDEMENLIADNNSLKEKINDQNNEIGIQLNTCRISQRRI